MIVPTKKKSELIAIFDELIANSKHKDGAFLVSKEVYEDCIFYALYQHKGIKIKLLY
jgi:hypothetical protein